MDYGVAMKRIGIFQLYNEFGIVEEYIEVLLQSLQSVLLKIIIVYNGDLKRNEVQKLLKYSNYIYERDNIGYDGGAYKDVFLKFHKEDWKQWDEVVLFNCTFYGPLFPWEKVFRRMLEEKVDFWGLSRHHGKAQIRENGDLAPEHLQSFFLVIEKKILESPHFLEFWEKLEYPQNYYEAIERFELGFTTFFKEKGYNYTSWLDVQGANSCIEEGVDPCGIYAYELVSNYNFPIIKYKAISIINFDQTKKVMEYVESSTNYDVKLIEKHIRNMSKKNKWKPFSFESLDNFVKTHAHIYIFGHGKYGHGLEQFFKYMNWNFECFIVSSVQYENEIAFDDFNMNECDGLIVALGRIMLGEVDDKIREKFKEEQLFFPN